MPNKHGHNYVQDMMEAERKNTTDKLMKLFWKMYEDGRAGRIAIMTTYLKGVRKKIRRILSGH